jgi:hypothetical protein
MQTMTNAPAPNAGKKPCPATWQRTSPRGKRPEASRRTRPSGLTGGHRASYFGGMAKSKQRIGGGVSHAARGRTYQMRRMVS